MVMKRNETRQINVGGLLIGGQNKVVIQSMCNIKTEYYEEVSKQINECAALGAEMMRVSVMDEKDALAIKEIKKRISIPSRSLLPVSCVPKRLIAMSITVTIH